MFVMDIPDIGHCASFSVADALPTCNTVTHFQVVFLQGGIHVTLLIRGQCLHLVTAFMSILLSLGIIHPSSWALSAYGYVSSLTI